MTNYQEINKELKYIREMKPILEERLDKLENPLVRVKYFFDKLENWRRKEIIGNVKNQFNYLDERYSSLRKIYDNRFKNHTPQELFDYLEKNNQRVRDLRKRDEFLEGKKVYLFSRKRISKIQTLVKDELGRRERVQRRLIKEIESDRNLSIEDYYTDKINRRILNINKN